MTAAWLVVLNWNGRQDTLDLLASLRGADLPDTTVLVVDNDSSDGTLEAVRREHPWVRTLQTGANLGYAGGNNRGIELAERNGATVIGVLNNDTLVRPDFWPPLVALAQEPKTAVCPDIRYAADPERSWFFGGIATRAEASTRHLQPAEQPPRDRVTDTQTLTGCCLVAGIDTWRLVGGFDERLYLIFEDADWSMRAHRHGVRLLLEPASRIEHKVSQSFDGQHQGLGLYYYCRNGLVFARRWFGWRAAARFAGRQVLAPGLRELRRAGPGAGRALLVRLGATTAAAAGARGAAGPMMLRLCAARAGR